VVASFGAGSVLSRARRGAAPLVSFFGCTVLMGCFIPVTPDFDVPPDSRSSCRGGPSTPNDELLRVDLDAFRVAERTELPLEVLVEDLDRNQPLTGLAYVNFPDRSEAGDEVERPGPVDDVRLDPLAEGEDGPRRADFAIPLTSFLLDGSDTGCRSLQVRVNPEYEGFTNPIPVDPDTGAVLREAAAQDAQEGICTWLVALVNEAQPTVDVTQCRFTNADAESM
jgi:hypothetical protein